MPDISSPYKYTEEFKLFIESKTNRGDFTYNNWSDKDLETIRSSIRSFYRNEQKGNCVYCRNPVSLQSASNCQVEHIAPKSLYPCFMFEPKNLCVICADCNEIKREQETIGEVEDPIINGTKRRRYPCSSKAFKIVHPHFDNYDDHIVIVGDYYLDKSKKGHFTIGVCRLNRKLHAFGWAEEIYNNVEVSELMSSFLNCSDPRKRNLYLTLLKKVLN